MCWDIVLLFLLHSLSCREWRDVNVESFLHLRKPSGEKKERIEFCSSSLQFIFLHYYRS